ncbi:hypothetical protein [Pelomicrobium methylotrophicum]|uniref:Uncharacterized protein n=1 Tax=Pelomicrobium methylotrophicum TaxID=2602750 RepID=A0A5C7EWZ0_9PROT|nr:hypothetical protein [Pelomicrobium methylotrophicum]TXF11565.1 hypothetical protein FR698_09505 [Pelomicrobium methylotrophicum]
MQEVEGVYSDEYIDYWGDVYVALDLRERAGVDFERFLKSPDTILREAGIEPLLPEQAEAAARIFSR